MSTISARTFVLLYWAAQALTLLPGLAPQHSTVLLGINRAWVTLLTSGVVLLHVLWIWQQVKLAAAPVAASSPWISRLLARIRTTGGVSLAGFLVLAAMKVAFGGHYPVLNNWLGAGIGVPLLGIVVSGVFAAQCLCKTEVELAPQAKPSVFGTFVLFFYAGLTAGAIARRARRAVAKAESEQLAVGVGA